MIHRFYGHYSDNESLLDSDLLVIKARGDNQSFFIRKRKVFVNDIAKYIIGCRKERNQKLKNLNFNLIRNSDMKITNQGMSLQRLKFNPDAIKFLTDEWVKSIYADHDYERVRQIKGYYVFAIDGTDLILPNSEEGYAYFGGSVSVKGLKTVQASASCLYDVINRVIIDSNINPFRTPENISAKRNIQVLDELVPFEKKILMFDRGYISTNLLVDIFQLKHKFIFRLPSNVFKNEVAAMSSNDGLITIEMTKERINAMRNELHYEQMMSVDHIVVRVVKIKLENGIEEILLTNLESNEFSVEELKELYRLRWEIETVYNALKHKIQIEKFSGYKRIIIEQDFYASIYLWNMMQDMVLDRRGDLSDEEKFYLHEMKISDSIAIELVRNNLLKILYSQDRKKDEFKNLVEEIIKHIEPVRPNRSFPRNIIKKDKNSVKSKESAKRTQARNRIKKKMLRTK